MKYKESYKKRINPINLTSNRIGNNGVKNIYDRISAIKVVTKYLITLNGFESLVSLNISGNKYSILLFLLYPNFL